MELWYKRLLSRWRLTPSVGGKKALTYRIFDFPVRSMNITKQVKTVLVTLSWLDVFVLIKAVNFRKYMND